MRPAGRQPGFRRRGQARRRLPHGPRHRELGQGGVGGDDLDVVGDEPEPVAQVEQADDEAGPGRASKTSLTGSSRLPMLKGWISQLGCPAAMLGQTSSMWAPRIFGSPGPKW